MIPHANSLKDFSDLSQHHDVINYKNSKWTVDTQSNTHQIYKSDIGHEYYGPFIRIDRYNKKPYTVHYLEGLGYPNYIITDPEMLLRSTGIDPLNKEDTMKKLLHNYKKSDHGHQQLIKQISALRLVGYDWPELKIIQKSIEADKGIYSY